MLGHAVLVQVGRRRAQHLWRCASGRTGRAGSQPASPHFQHAAALSLTSIWAAWFDRLGVNRSVADAGKGGLSIGAAAGVGSIAILLVKQLAGRTVLATAPRPASVR